MGVVINEILRFWKAPDCFGLDGICVGIVRGDVVAAVDSVGEEILGGVGMMVGLGPSTLLE